MIFFNYLVISFAIVRSGISKGIDLQQATQLFNETRRVLRGHDVGDTRPYMVYLRPAVNANPQVKETNWLCGGVIVHERYVLTSAACIEDAKQFYVISGTHRWAPVPEHGERLDDDECITNSAKKAVWKCVPKSYVFDGNAFDNIRWMISDIAIVKVEDDFNFNKRVRGCDFIPQKIAYNNQNEDLERPKTAASIAGWGSTDKFTAVRKATDVTSNSPTLLETDVVLVSKNHCKKRWPERYHYIIDESMICSKDMDADSMSTACLEHDVNCKELNYSEEEDDDETRRFIVDPEKLIVHDAGHKHVSRRSKPISGGFCENDHGGPLVVGHGKTSVVVGIISACLTQELTHKCYGPFLYTSVWTYRNLINCAIDKETEATCRRLLESTKPQETLFDWSSHPDGPPKSPITHTEKFRYLRSVKTKN